MTAEECAAAILAAEETARLGIERELRDMRGYVCSYPDAGPIWFVERRWLAWLDARIAAIEREYDESNPV